MSPNPLGIDPTLLHLGPLQVRWYGLMYVIGFVIGTQILNHLSTKNFLKISKEQIDKYVTRLIVGMFLGARIFYVFIYNWDHYSQNPSKIIAVWEGGLSFHGAVVGMCIASFITAKKHNLHFFQITDCLALAGPVGLFLGRIGNFINGELYGRITDSAFGMVFLNGGPMPRHPSQLYEAFSEGFILFFILWYLHKKQKIYGIVSTFFVAGYGTFRYIVEFFRQPDAQLGYYFGGTTTMGQILCILMVLSSLIVYYFAKKAAIANPLVDSKEA